MDWQIDNNTAMKNKKKKSANSHKINGLQTFSLAGAEGLEPSARGFGDRCSTI
jgi:hypothetical protein